MKRFLLLSLTLAIVSLACLQTASIGTATPAISPTGFSDVKEIESGEVFYIPVMVITPAPQICAVVIAEEALHLRNGPSENDIVLAWLKNGEVVQVMDQSNDDWWLVGFEKMTGYARAKYLKESEC